MEFARVVPVLGLVLLGACVAPPPPLPEPIRVTPQPATLPPAPPPAVSTAPLAAPVVETVSDGQLIDLSDDSDIIGFGENSGAPVPPTRRPECVPSLDNSGNPDCALPEPEATTDLEIRFDSGIAADDSLDFGASDG